MLLCVALISGIYAQNQVDALRYSNTMFGGTARYVGVGGAFGAVGADFSTLSSNPAGIGLFKTSEFSFTPSMFIGKTTASYNGKSMDDLRYNFNMGHAGMVLTFQGTAKKDKPGWRNVQFGFGINRSQNFNNRILLEGDNLSSSMLDAWVNYSNGYAYDDLNGFDTQLGFDTWLLDTIAGDSYHYKSAKPSSGVTQRKSIETSGSMNEWVFTLGANYNDRFYIGGTLGFPYLKYKEQSTYTEIAKPGPILPLFNEFEEFSYRNDLTTTGSGINFKLGFIFKPVDFVRIGGAIHTPTSFYSMHDNYSSSVESRFNNGDQYEAESPDGEFDYKLTTPMRMMGSVAFIVGKMGLISADYEYVDYSEARLRSDNADDFFDANDAIRSSYTAAHVVRVGTEWRYEQFSFRGGYGMYGSPFKSGLNDGGKTTYSLGLGIREEGYFIDFAYLRTMAKEDYYLYEISPSLLNPVKNDFLTQSFMMTLGLKF